MKLSHLDLYTIRVGRETGVTNEHIIVRLESTSGATGWGEMSDLSHLPMYRFDVPQLELSLREILIGADPGQFNAIERRLIGFFPDEGHMYSRSGLIRQGIDLALHDLVARDEGVPVHQLLGGAVRDRIPVCYPVFRLRTEDQVGPALDRVQTKLDEGFSTIRIYVGSAPAADEMFVAGLVERFGARVRIKSLDFSNLLDWRRALAHTERLTAMCDVMLVESVAPRDDIEGLAEFRRRSRWPVSEHVHGARHAWDLLRRGGVDILNISPYVLGGLRASLRIAAVAEAAGASVLVGTTQELNLGTAAAAHLGAVLHALPFPADNTGPRLYTSDVVTDGVEYEHGDLLVPTGPGLGPVVDAMRLKDLSSDGRWSFGMDLAGALDRTVAPAGASAASRDESISK
jgi:L-alanine-DL-glutamate epimerase-like enolase superfamily enzyme